LRITLFRASITHIAHDSRGENFHDSFMTNDRTSQHSPCGIFTAPACARATRIHRSAQRAPTCRRDDIAALRIACDARSSRTAALSAIRKHVSSNAARAQDQHFFPGIFDIFFSCASLARRHDHTRIGKRSANEST
jgi:hypothetical protein